MILSSTGCTVRNRQNKDKVTYIDYINEPDGFYIFSGLVL